MHVDGHAGVGGVVVHVAHGDDLDAGEFLHQPDALLVHHLAAAGAEGAALLAQAGRKVRHEEGEHFAAQQAADHQEVTGAEGVLLLRGHPEIEVAVEGEGDGLGFQNLEQFRPVQQAHVHAAAVRTVVMDDLEVRVGDGGLGHQVFQDVAVLDLGDAQDGVVGLVLVPHRPDDLGHVGELLLVLELGPLVRAVGKVLVVVLPFVVVGVKQVLQVVETDDIVLPALGEGGRGQDDKHGKDGYQSFHGRCRFSSTTS